MIVGIDIGGSTTDAVFLDGENISFTLSFTVEPKRRGRELALVTGDVEWIEQYIGALEPKHKRLFEAR